MFTSIPSPLRSPRARPAVKTFLSIALLVSILIATSSCSFPKSNGSTNKSVTNHCFYLSDNGAKIASITFFHNGINHVTLTNDCSGAVPAWKVQALTSKKEPDGTANGIQIAWLTIDPTQGGEFAYKHEPLDLFVNINPSSPPLPTQPGIYQLTFYIYQEPGDLLGSTCLFTVVIPLK